MKENLGGPLRNSAPWIELRGVWVRPVHGDSPSPPYSVQTWNWGIHLRWLLGVILAFATSTFAGALYVDSAREQSGLGNKPLTGLGRNIALDDRSIKADREMRSKLLGSDRPVRSPAD